MTARTDVLARLLILDPPSFTLHRNCRLCFFFFLWVSYQYRLLDLILGGRAKY